MLVQNPPLASQKSSEVSPSLGSKDYRVLSGTAPDGIGASSPSAITHAGLDKQPVPFYRRCFAMTNCSGMPYSPGTLMFTTPRGGAGFAEA